MLKSPRVKVKVTTGIFRLKQKKWGAKVRCCPTAGWVLFTWAFHVMRVPGFLSVEIRLWNCWTTVRLAFWLFRNFAQSLTVFEFFCVEGRKDSRFQTIWIVSEPDNRSLRPRCYVVSHVCWVEFVIILELDFLKKAFHYNLKFRNLQKCQHVP